ncbi:rep [Macaca mulatta feces associated virus 2]|uniref:Rep n=1 Tax=Macaca mulatta feces associated virus 2 TaxID=2499224 RepID=A0A1W5PW13_9VIRU|nr:rep [Macaca mulatta feces associated virus 2]APG55791.1 rep [Macaca mulatta feces associated virus 2]
MTKTVMITMERRETYKEWNWFLFAIRKLDIHKWIIAAEEGKGGYKHWQIRIASRFDAKWWTRALLIQFGQRSIHTENASNTWTYEAKEGCYLASWDTLEVRQQRFGKLRKVQKYALNVLEGTNDRQVMVWVDEEGNSGKSWLIGHLYETGQAYYAPPYLTSVKEIIQTIASLAVKDRDAGNPPKKYALIDIPRSWKWSNELYTAIEAIKDGLIMEPRYSAQPINIKGIKVLVVTNTRPKLDKLSKDRWEIFEWDNNPTIDTYLRGAQEKRTL